MDSADTPDDEAARKNAAKALDAAISARRELIGKRWNAVASDADLTPVHLRRIRNGETPLSRFNAAALDRALQWPNGHTWSVYEEHLEASEPELLDEGEREIWGMKAVPAALRRSYIQQYREQKQQPGTGTE